MWRRQRHTHTFHIYWRSKFQLDEWQMRNEGNHSRALLNSLPKQCHQIHEKDRVFIGRAFNSIISWKFAGAECVGRWTADGACNINGMVWHFLQLARMEQRNFSMQKQNLQLFRARRKYELKLESIFAYISIHRFPLCARGILLSTSHANKRVCIHQEKRRSVTSVFRHTWYFFFSSERPPPTKCETIRNIYTDFSFHVFIGSIVFPPLLMIVVRSANRNVYTET